MRSLILLALLAPGQQPRLLPSVVQGNAAPLAAQSTMTEHLHSFDPRTVRLGWNNRRWQLTVNGLVLKDFGTREQEARQALYVILELGLNQYGTIGSPVPVMEYWLKDGQAPQGLIRNGLRGMALEPRALTIGEMQGQWCVKQGPRALFNFGPNVNDARQALAVINKYQFNQVGLIGQGTPSMYVFMHRDTLQPAAANSMNTPGVRTSGKSIPVTRFSRLAKNQPAKQETSNPLAALPIPALPAISAPPGQAHGSRQDQAFKQKPSWHQPHFGPHRQVANQQPESVKFDWRQADLRQENGEWKLKAGSLVLANFGPSVNDARLALRALRHYRFTELHHVGEEKPFSYFSSGAQSLRGVMVGLPSESLAPDQLAVQQVGKKYALCQRGRVVLTFGQRQDEAQKVLEVIKTNKFDRICRLGEPGKEGMTFLVKSR